MSARPGPKPGFYEPEEFASEPAAGAPLVPALASVPPAPRRRRYGRWFAYLALAFFGAVLAYDAAQFLWSLFAVSYLAGALGSALLLAALVAGVVWIAHEVRSLRALGVADHLRTDSAALRADPGHGRAIDWIARAAPAARANPAAREGMSRLRDMLSDVHTNAEALALFEREVVEPLDRQASAAIARAARDTAIGVAASPVALLDAVIGIARALRMIRAVATIYGLRPSTLSSLRLLKRALLDGAGFATADIAGDAWTEVLSGLGSRVTGFVSARLGEGVFAAVRMTRLGLTAVQACRPIPFAGDKRLASLRQDLVKQAFAGLLPSRRREEAENAKPII
jgi:putative membrane protein